LRRKFHANETVSVETETERETVSVETESDESPPRSGVLGVILPSLLPALGQAG